MRDFEPSWNSTRTGRDIRGVATIAMRGERPDASSTASRRFDRSKWSGLRVELGRLVEEIHAGFDQLRVRDDDVATGSVLVNPFLAILRLDRRTQGTNSIAGFPQYRHNVLLNVNASV